MSAIFNDPVDGLRVLSAPKRLDIDAAESFRDELQRAIDEDRCMIVINLVSTRYIDSSGLGSIVSRIAAVRANNGDIRIASAAPNIVTLLEMTHLNKVLQCYPDEESAIASYKDKK